MEDVFEGIPNFRLSTDNVRAIVWEGMQIFLLFSPHWPPSSGTFSPHGSPSRCFSPLRGWKSGNVVEIESQVVLARIAYDSVHFSRERNEKIWLFLARLWGRPSVVINYPIDYFTDAHFSSASLGRRYDRGMESVEGWIHTAFFRTSFSHGRNPPRGESGKNSNEVKSIRWKS